MTKTIKKLGNYLRKKSWWVLNSHALLIESEADKNWNKNESALMRHIISNWFEK